MRPGRTLKERSSTASTPEPARPKRFVRFWTTTWSVVVELMAASSRVVVQSLASDCAPVLLSVVISRVGRSVDGLGESEGVVVGLLVGQPQWIVAVVPAWWWCPGRMVSMAYDEGLAERLLEEAGADAGISTRKMFGGLAVMQNGHMLAGVLGDDLMARVGPDAYQECLEEPGASPMDFTGRPLTGMLTVAGDSVASDESLAAWVARCKAFVASLPPKT